MTIIHLSSTLGGGGAEHIVLELSKKSSPGIRTVVVSISDLNTIEHKFVKNNIEVHFLGVNSFKNKTLLQGLKKFKKILHNVEKPIIHSHQFYGGIFAVLYTMFIQKVPVLFTLHTNKLNPFYKRLLLFFTKPFRQIDIIFTKSSKKWYLKNNAIISNGVDFAAFEKNNNRIYAAGTTFKYLFLGRLSQPKNPLFMIKAAKYLLENDMSDFIINVVGEGNMRNQLIRDIKDHDLTDHFKLLGFQDDISSFLFDAHCLILPSIREGMPVVILEAAASKLPIIATAVGSIPDILNQSNSYISSLNQFPKSMIAVKKNYKEALEKADSLYEEIKSTHDIKNVYREHLNLYNSLANQI